MREWVRRSECKNSGVPAELQFTVVRMSYRLFDLLLFIHNARNNLISIFFSLIDNPSIFVTRRLIISSIIRYRQQILTRSFFNILFRFSPFLRDWLIPLVSYTREFIIWYRYRYSTEAEVRSSPSSSSPPLFLPPRSLWSCSFRLASRIVPHRSSDEHCANLTILFDHKFDSSEYNFSRW